MIGFPQLEDKAPKALQWLHDPEQLEEDKNKILLDFIDTYIYDVRW